MWRFGISPDPTYNIPQHVEHNSTARSSSEEASDNLYLVGFSIHFNPLSYMQAETRSLCRCGNLGVGVDGIWYPIQNDECITWTIDGRSSPCHNFCMFLDWFCGCPLHWKLLQSKKGDGTSSTASIGTAIAWYRRQRWIDDRSWTWLTGE